MTSSRLLHIALFFSVVSITACTCNRVLPNFEGVKMEGYGRNGREDFKAVTGAQGMMGPGSELFQVPMWEQKADPSEVNITAKDAGSFSVDPTYTYAAMRGKGVDIIFHYKHLGIDEPNVMMDNIESNVLNQMVVNAYREEGRNYSTDSLMNYLSSFEKAVEKRLREEFNQKFFTLLALTSGLKPPTSMVEAIEKRNNAIQQAEQVKNELEVA
jgi:hypothetical protein